MKKKEKKTLPGKKTPANRRKSVPSTETKPENRELGSRTDSLLPNNPGLDRPPVETSITRLGTPLKFRQQDGVTCVDGDKSSYFRTFGTSDTDLGSRLFIQVAASLSPGSPDDHNYILAALQGIGPRDALEGTLAAQMVAVDHAAMTFMARATAQGQPSEAVDANLNRVNKLLRTFTEQLDALNRHRRKITQAMVVGNVNVADGGQAIVGPVNHPGPGKVSKDSEKEKVG